MGEIAQYPYKPSQRDRALVENAAAIGVAQPHIARFLGICLTTLLRHYRNELDNGAFRANLKIGHVMYELATEAEDPMVRYRAAAYWLARRAGWTEKGAHIHAHVHGAAHMPVTSDMTPQEAIDAYQQLLRSVETPVIDGVA